MSKTLDAAKVAGYPYTDGGKLDVLGDEGIIPSGTKIIEENGEHDVYSFEKVDVNVAGDITVNESYDISEGTLTKGNVTLEGDVVANIPDGVTTIGNKAFMNNVTITEVIIPDSVTTIENGTFQYPSSPNNAMAFGNCLSLKEVVFFNNLTNIGGCAFYGCSSLTSIVIPDSVTSIGGSAFGGCTGLTSITIPDSVTSIGDGAFSGCSGLTSITIPDSVTSIGSSTFSDCEALTDIYYTGTQAEWEAITGIGSAGIPAGATIHYEYTPE